METQDLGFAAKETAARHAIEQVLGIKVDSRGSHAAVASMVDGIRELEKALEAEYAALPVIQEARRLAAIKSELAKSLEAARKTAKSRLLAFEYKLDAERVAAERQAQAEAVKLAEQAALEAAVEAEQVGDVAQAEAILAEPLAVALVVVPEEKLKAKGHTRRRVWKSKIVDASKIPSEYMAPDLDKISATVRAWKRDGEVIPGVMAWSEVV